MNEPSDESRIRQMLQRAKRADQHRAPAFDEVMNRPMPISEHPALHRMKLAAVCCVAVALTVAIVWQAARNDDAADPQRRIVDLNSSAPTVDRVPNSSVVDVDFDYLRQVVDEHFGLSHAAANEPMPVWSSRTESLLALNLNVKINQE